MASNRKSGWSKWIVILVVLGAAGAAVYYFRNDHSEAPQYQTVSVTRGDLTQSVSASGTLNPVLNIQVGSQISGNIAKLLADWNSLVKSNQVVALIDPAPFKAAVHQAEGDLANARASLELQTVEAKRQKQLFDAKLISASDNDTAVASLHQAQAQVQMKQAALEKAQLDLDHCTIYSPVDGIVISRNVDVGQTVAASMNAPVLFQIANDLANMQIDANVSEADVGTVETNQRVTFTVDAYPNRTFIGGVTQIRNSPVTVQNVVTYDTVIGVTNSDFKLKPGMTATVSIITGQRTNVLKVPNAALRFRPPEASTNQTLVARLLAKIGLGKESRTGSTNAVTTAGGTNKVETAEAGQPPLTGNEPPEVLMRRVREMRDRGEEPPPEIRAKLRELFQSGALQRAGGGPPGAGGPGSRPRTAPSWRTLYVLVTNTPPGSSDPVIVPQATRVRTGITDGSYTEITEGLKEGDAVITSVHIPSSQSSSAMGGSSPFGGPRFR
ncbi:MAG TPA: efflux RND transporter periplasmic adaptor subunit [Candidatus Acidoferrum sp.]|nr:efflux RND transporter periplasmic adaptor subunit [Candidatus Acidoferrum sp.]